MYISNRFSEVIRAHSTFSAKSDPLISLSLCNTLVVRRHTMCGRVPIGLDYWHRKWMYLALSSSFFRHEHALVVTTQRVQRVSCNLMYHVHKDRCKFAILLLSISRWKAGFQRSIDGKLAVKYAEPEVVIH
jgi:hypothetical protein